MSVERLNPNHPVAQAMTPEFLYKLVALLVSQAGGSVTINNAGIYDHVFFEDCRNVE
jgi:hypothetical protein